MSAEIFQNILLTFIIFTVTFSTISFIRYVLKVRKILKLYKDNPNIQGIAIVDGQIQIIERRPATTMQEIKPKEIILDPVCGKTVERKNAYRVMKNDKEYFFCSWECREEFLKTNKEDMQEGNS